MLLFKKYNILYLFVCIACLGLFRNQVSAAEVKLRESKSFVADKETRINITGNKANITAQGWDKDSIKITMTITFNHNNKNTALKESTYSINNIVQRGSVIFANNNFSLPSNKTSLESVVKVQYTVFMPFNNMLIINNKYGNCTLKNLSGYLNISNYYGNVQMNKVKGNIQVYGGIGNVTANDIGGKVLLQRESTEINLTNINGMITIENKTANITISAGNNLQLLQIQNSFGEVSVHLPDVENFSYDLKTKHGQIKVPTDNAALTKLIESGKLNYNAGNNIPLIKVTTSFNNINIYQL